MATDPTKTDLPLDEAAALAPLVDASEAVARVDAGAVLFDTRGDISFERDGAFEGATRLNRETVDVVFALDAAERPLGVDKDTEIVVACGSVRVSGPVAARLRELGYTNVVHVDGGVSALRAERESAASA